MSSGARRALAAGKQSSSWQLESSEAAVKAQRALRSSQGGWSGALSAAAAGVPGERILLLAGWLQVTQGRVLQHVQCLEAPLQLL